MDLRALIAEADRMDSEEPVDDPVVPEVTVEEQSEPEDVTDEQDQPGPAEDDAEPPETDVEPVDDAESPDVAVDGVDDPESPDVAVEEPTDAEAPDVAVDDLEEGDAPDLAEDEQSTNEPAVNMAEPEAGPLDDTVDPSVTEPAAIDEPDVPSEDTEAEQPLQDPALEEPDVPDDPLPADDADGGSEDPVGLVEVNDLAPVTESEFRKSQDTGEMPGFEDAVSRQMMEQTRVGTEIAASIAKELNPQFDDLRDHLAASTQDFMTMQSIILQFTKD